MRLPKIEVLNEMGKIITFLRKTGVNMNYFCLSIGFNTCLIFFNLYVIALLFPLANGIIKNDFSAVKSLQIVGAIARHFPSVFSSSTSLFLLLVGWVYLATIIKNALSYGAFLSMSYQAKKASNKIRMIIFDRYLSFGKLFFDRNNITKLNFILTQSADSMDAQLGTLQNLLSQVLAFLVFLSMMFKISWELTLVTLTVFPLMSYATKVVSKKIKDASMKYIANINDLSKKIYNVLSGMTVVKGFGKEVMEREYFATVSEKEIRQSFDMQKLTYLIGPIQDISTTTALLLTAWAMALLISFKSIPAANTFVFFYLAVKTVPVFNAMNNFKLSLAAAAGPLKQLDDILKDEDKYILPNGHKKFAGLKKSIELKNLNFSYNKINYVLNNTSFTIEKGKTTALVGPTGAGKTTIINLILRFYDCPAGSIFLDGVDIKDFNVELLRKGMVFVSQDIVLFDDTVKSNICYALSEPISGETLVEISKKSRIYDFVMALPQKYDTHIGERGVRLSGGEKQRISIARALLKKAEILIMDEATSSLDSHTEQLIQQAINETLRGRTAVIIAHRLSTIKHADKIVVIENGAVAEQGSLDELLAKKGAFHKYWEAQKFF